MGNKKDVEVGARIRYLRKRRGFSQEELAKKIGYTSKTTINKIELGINSLKQSTLEQIAFALHTTPSYLMGWDEDNDLILTEQEQKIIRAYRENEDLQPVIRKILDIN